MRRKGGRFSVTLALPSEGRQMDAARADRQRVDRWLWHARLVRTRSAAAALAAAGYVRINGTRIDAPGRMVRLGDVITVALDHAVRVLKVRGFRERRGPPSCGPELYEELG
jgi:ribosomal 50S subunit-recycling heat shock protein